MKKLWASTALLFSTAFALAHEDLYVKASRLDGLPLKINDTRLLKQPLDGLPKEINLSEAFAELGVNLPDGGSILYNTRSGWVIRRLDDATHDMVDHILDSLYRRETATAIAGAYLELLKPLPKEERIQAVLRIGYFPDPLVAGYLDEVRQMRSGRQELEEDPFLDDPDPPQKPPSAEQQARIKQLEELIGELLDRSLVRLAEQLEIIERATPQAETSKAQSGPGE
jgi:hypothetical protein